VSQKLLHKLGINSFREEHRGAGWVESASCSEAGPVKGPRSRGRGRSDAERAREPLAPFLVVLF
jgi:hypothetical protein